MATPAYKPSVLAVHDDAGTSSYIMITLMGKEAFVRQVFIQMWPMDTERSAGIIGTFGSGRMTKRSIIIKTLTSSLSVRSLNPDCRVCKPYFPNIHCHYFEKKAFQRSIIRSLFSSTNDSASFSSAGLKPLLSSNVTSGCT